MTYDLIMGIVFYVIVAFLTAVTIGFFRPYMDDCLGWLISCLWPLTLIIIGVVSLGDWIDYWTYRNPSAAHRICGIFECITIPFRPITLGRKIRKWHDSRHKRQCN